MADQASTIMDESVVRSAMAEFDTPHLCKLSALIYDRWNWDTGSEIDKRWMEIADEILETRGVSLNMSQASPGRGPMITCDPNGPQELILKVDKLILEDPAGGAKGVLFESFAGVELGYEMKQAILKFLEQELQGKNVMSTQGRYLKDILGEAAAEAVREKLY